MLSGLERRDGGGARLEEGKRHGRGEGAGAEVGGGVHLPSQFLTISRSVLPPWPKTVTPAKQLFLRFQMIWDQKKLFWLKIIGCRTHQPTRVISVQAKLPQKLPRRVRNVKKLHHRVRLSS